jgi:hypothetical protein
VVQEGPSLHCLARLAGLAGTAVQRIGKPSKRPGRGQQASWGSCPRTPRHCCLPTWRVLGSQTGAS